MSIMSTHRLRTKGWDRQLYIMGNIITGVQGMSLLSTHLLGTKKWDGQLMIFASIVIGLQGMTFSLLISIED